MTRLEFQNAVVKDSGHGLKVNGTYLSDIISTALGTKVGNTYGYGSGLPDFESTCCNVTVIIDPQPITTHIEDDKYEYDSVEDLEEDKREQYKKKTQTPDPEE